MDLDEAFLKLQAMATAAKELRRRHQAWRLLLGYDVRRTTVVYGHHGASRCTRQRNWSIVTPPYTSFYPHSRCLRAWRRTPPPTVRLTRAAADVIDTVMVGAGLPRRGRRAQRIRTALYIPRYSPCEAILVVFVTMAWVHTSSLAPIMTRLAAHTICIKDRLNP